MIAIAVMLLWLAVWECFSHGSDAWFAAGEVMGIVFGVLVWISVLLTVISGGVYLKGYWKYIDMK